MLLPFKAQKKGMHLTWILRSSSKLFIIRKTSSVSAYLTFSKYSLASSILLALTLTTSLVMIWRPLARQLFS